jgi:hypothetical protein
LTGQMSVSLRVPIVFDYVYLRLFVTRKVCMEVLGRVIKWVIQDIT